MFNPFKKTYSKQEEELFAFLRQNRLFQKLNNEELYEFLPFLYPRNFEQNEVIFFRGDPSQAFYLVREGVVSLSIDTQETFEELTQVHSTQGFGENALIEGSTRIYNAVCHSERCSLFVIPTTNISEIFEDHVHIKAKMMYALAHYHNQYMGNLFSAYKSSFGFFNLGMAYASK